ncbi:MAG: DUF4900 domain-containing protein [Dictyoglomus sp.]|nr:DUF4900 domain-containing protein [Dictyoglomus sp.]MDW8188700.1 DUF4900 domain-containing protein [Dictyoglomus sp.]
MKTKPSNKKEKGDLSLITAITFGFLITSLVFLLLTSTINENFFVRRDQARDQVLNATQAGIKNVLSIAHWKIQEEIPRRRISDITQDFLRNLLSPSNLSQDISEIYNQTQFPDPTTSYTILSYTFSLLDYSTDVSGITTRVFYTYVYTITSRGYKVNYNPRLSLTITTRGRIEGSVFVENFARFALFTNNHTLPDGSTVWFTSRTIFRGPVHSNTEFAFAYTPTFTDQVSSSASTALFYTATSYIRLNADSNPPYATPIFQRGFIRNAPQINLPPSTDTQLSASLGGTYTGTFPNENQRNQYIRQMLGLPVNNDPPPNGIYTQTILNGGGIYIQGNVDINFGLDSQNRAVYTITQGNTTYVFTIDETQNKTFVRVGTNTIEINRIPNGVIYVNGQVNSVSGTIQRNQRITLCARNNITITNHIRYQDNPLTNPNAVNILGILSESGNILIDPVSNHTDADPSDPDLDFEIDATLMAPQGVVQVANYNTRSPQGDVILTGGIISNFYGAFGTFGSGGTPRTGYGREFWYDYRMRDGYAPPFFPTTGRTLLREGRIEDPRWIKIENWEEKWE